MAAAGYAMQAAKIISAVACPAAPTGSRGRPRRRRRRGRPPAVAPGPTAGVGYSDGVSSGAARLNITRLGIDFGTSSTVAVIQVGDRPPRPLLFDGSPLMPSAACADPTGRILVGRDAVQLATPHRPVTSRTPNAAWTTAQCCWPAATYRWPSCSGPSSHG
jgi:hypothetical protein